MSTQINMNESGDEYLIQYKVDCGKKWRLRPYFSASLINLYRWPQREGITLQYSHPHLMLIRGYIENILHIIPLERCISHTNMIPHVGEGGL